MYRSCLLFFKPEGLLDVGDWLGAAHKKFDRFWAQVSCVNVPSNLVVLLTFLPGAAGA